jgi:hypothetical protein
MALSAKFSLIHSELNDFLFAEMGEEASGAPISVLSALTRLGVDPWEEGARLSDMPREVAARGLVSMIEMFPREERGSSEVLALAERLAGLLPRRNPARAAAVVVSNPRQWIGSPMFWSLAIGALLVLCGMAALGLLPGQ